MFADAGGRDHRRSGGRQPISLTSCQAHAVEVTVALDVPAPGSPGDTPVSALGLYVLVPPTGDGQQLEPAPAAS